MSHGVKSESFRASYLQGSLYRSVDGASSAVNLGIMLDLTGPLDRPRLLAALHRLSARHEALRTILTSDDGQILQEVADATRVHLLIEDVADRSAPNSEATRLARQHVAQPFAFHGPTLWRAMLIKCGLERHVLTLSLHHAIVDGSSATILVNELCELYDNPDGDSIPPPDLQFADYAAWERGTAASVPVAAWKDRLRPYRESIHPVCGASIGREYHTVPYEIPDMQPGHLLMVRKLAKALRTPVVAVLVAAAAASLGNGRSEAVIGLVRANRERTELRDVVGYVADLTPLTIDLSGSPTLTDLTQRAAESLAFSHDHPAPLAALSPLLRDGGTRGPLLDVCLNYRPAHTTPERAVRGLRVVSTAVPQPTVARHHWWDGAAAIDFQLRVDNGRLTGHVGIDSHSVPPQLAQAITDRFARFLIYGAARPDVPVGEWCWTRQGEKWTNTTRA